MAAGEETRLVYFAPEFTETSTLKRVREFLDMGMSPIVLGFERGRYNRFHRPEWPHVLLGRTRDKRYVSRLIALLSAIPVLVRTRASLSRARIFYARNIDQLVMALFSRIVFNRRAAVVYEILDVQPIFTGRSLASRLLRGLERFCLRFIDLLVVSSPAFYRNYYEAVQGYRGPWHLLENKLHQHAVTAPARSGWVGHENGRPWVIGYFGLIRGQATLDLISRIAARLGRRVEFDFRGVLTTINDRSFSAALCRNSNIRYGGEYANPQDLPALYGGVDFAWAIDLENVEANSRWLLPCRFYEAGAFGIPCLAAADFEVGRRIEELGVGWTFREPFEDSIVEFFLSLSNDEYKNRRRRLASLPRRTFITQPEDREFAREIDQALQRRSGVAAAPTATVLPIMKAGFVRGGSAPAVDRHIVERQF